MQSRSKGSVTMGLSFVVPRYCSPWRAVGVLWAVMAAQGLAPSTSFCIRSPLATTRSRPWDKLQGGRSGSTVMQILPEGGQSPCNIKVRVFA